MAALCRDTRVPDPAPVTAQCTWNALKHKPHLWFPLPGMCLNGCSDRTTEKFGLKGTFYSHLLQWAAKSSSCSEPRPTQPWMFPGIRHLALWATCSRVLKSLLTKKKKSSLYLVLKSTNSLQLLQQRVCLGASRTPHRLVGGSPSRRWDGQSQLLKQKGAQILGFLNLWDLRIWMPEFSVRDCIAKDIRMLWHLWIEDQRRHLYLLHWCINANDLLCSKGNLHTTCLQRQNQGSHLGTLLTGMDYADTHMTVWLWP